MAGPGQPTPKQLLCGKATGNAKFAFYSFLLKWVADLFYLLYSASGQLQEPGTWAGQGGSGEITPRVLFHMCH